MTPYAVKFIPSDDIELFEKIKKAINFLPDLDLGRDVKGLPIILSCHMLARAVAEVFSLRCVDGYYYLSYQHSWVLTQNNKIIDVHPIAILGGPILVHNAVFSPHSHIYIEKEIIRISDEFNEPYFKDIVKLIASQLIH